MLLWPRSQQVQSLQPANLLVIQRWFSCYIRYGVKYTSVINRYLKYRSCLRSFEENWTDVNHSHSSSISISNDP